MAPEYTVLGRVARRTEEEKQSQLQRLQQAVIDNQNVFAVLMDAVRCCSLGQITNALFEVGGQYRRSV
jgi:isobutyryl-CoA mutase